MLRLLYEKLFIFQFSPKANYCTDVQNLWKKWNGAGENRTPVPKQSTTHVYANSQMFNLGTTSLHLTN